MPKRPDSHEVFRQVLRAVGHGEVSERLSKVVTKLESSISNIHVALRDLQHLIYPYIGILRKVTQVLVLMSTVFIYIYIIIYIGVGL